jgi:hypothetical protein
MILIHPVLLVDQSMNFNLSFFSKILFHLFSSDDMLSSGDDDHSRKYSNFSACAILTFCKLMMFSPSKEANVSEVFSIRDRAT